MYSYNTSKFTKKKTRIPFISKLRYKNLNVYIYFKNQNYTITLFTYYSNFKIRQFVLQYVYKT